MSATARSASTESPGLRVAQRATVDFSPLELFENHRPDLDSGVTRSGLCQLIGIHDPPQVSGQLPFRHGSQRFEIDVWPRSEGDRKCRHVMGDVHTAHARSFSLPGWSSHSRWSSEARAWFFGSRVSGTRNLTYFGDARRHPMGWPTLDTICEPL
jgi:hypothetical protein